LHAAYHVDMIHFMKLVFASDSFKGSLTSIEIGELLEMAARDVFPDAECIVCPIADGGEGTLDALSNAHAGQLVAFPAHDGLMRPIEGKVLTRDGKAYVEAASTCGLTLLEDDERNPRKTSSYGVGESIRFALDQQCDEIFVGLGGSCTNDGGMGCLRALGVRFYDESNDELLGCGADLARIERIDVSNLDPRVTTSSIIIMSDVDNPLLGRLGATRVFGRQKGADDAALDDLESGMRHFADRIAALRPDVDFDTPGFGAAGGLGMALSVFLKAEIRSGVEELLRLVGFDSLLEGADLVVTGEGRLDEQSLRGKAMSGIAEHAHRAGVPVAAVCGTVALGIADVDELGFAYVIDISAGQTLDYAMKHARQNYLAAACNLFRRLEGTS